jgi:uncharacterized protein with FMN-binding domain
MQLQVTMTGQRITKVAVLQHTDDGDESARIDAVSGASYTSTGYIKSLQSALLCDRGALTIVGT